VAGVGAGVRKPLAAICAFERLLSAVDPDVFLIDKRRHQNLGVNNFTAYATGTTREHGQLHNKQIGYIPLIKNQNTCFHIWSITKKTSPKNFLKKGCVFCYQNYVPTKLEFVWLN